MNTERLRQLSRVLRSEEEIRVRLGNNGLIPMRFHMLDWAFHVEEKNTDGVETVCGTVGCIAGWAVAVYDGEVPRTVFDAWRLIPDRARELLDLTQKQADNLFNGIEHITDPKELEITAGEAEVYVGLDWITRPVAADACLMMADIGKVDWYYMAWRHNEELLPHNRLKELRFDEYEEEGLPRGKALEDAG